MLEVEERDFQKTKNLKTVTLMDSFLGNKGGRQGVQEKGDSVISKGERIQPRIDLNEVTTSGGVREPIGH